MYLIFSFITFQTLVILANAEIRCAEITKPIKIPKTISHIVFKGKPTIICLLDYPNSSAPTSSTVISSAPTSSIVINSAPTSSTPTSSTPISSAPISSTPTSSSSAPTNSIAISDQYQCFNGSVLTPTMKIGNSTGTVVYGLPSGLQMSFVIWCHYDFPEDPNLNPGVKDMLIMYQVDFQDCLSTCITYNRLNQTWDKWCTGVSYIGSNCWLKSGIDQNTHAGPIQAGWSATLLTNIGSVIQFPRPY